jgi:FAD/FMN-containing dehydrogenase
VTADGELVRASASENPELLWALRGGGGNFGVVTELELQLHPVGPEVLAGFALYPAARGRELLGLYRDVMTAAPDELSLAYIHVEAPDEPEVPAELRGRQAVMIAGMYAGPVEDGEATIAALRAAGPAADLFGPMPYADFQSMLDDPPGYRNYWTAEHVRDLTEDAIESIVARSERIPAGTRSMLFVAAWGGAIRQRGDDHSPLAGRDTGFVVHPLFLWEDPADDAHMIALARGYRDDLRAHATGAVYLNFVGDEGERRVRAGFGERNHERLARVKRTWDPGNVFRQGQNVRPALVASAA